MTDGPAIQTPQLKLPRRRARLRSWLSRAAALILSVAILAMPSLVAAPPAEAAVRNFGFQGGTGAGSGWLGSVLTDDGTMAFCVDPAGFFPSASTASNSLVSSFAGTTAAANPGHNGTASVSGTDITKLNYALNTYASGANTNILAAGLAAYVNSITSSLHPGDGVWYYINIRVVNNANRDAVYARYLAIKADVEANYYKAAGTNTATLGISMDPLPSTDGTLNVTVSPTNATGVVTLTGAVFTATGLTTANVANGSSLRISAIDPGNGELYEIGAAGVFTGPTTWAQQVRLWTTGNVNQQMQRVISPGPRNTGNFSATAFANDPLANEFEPVVTTEAQSALLNPGDPVIDKLTASVVDSVLFPWRSTASGPLPVVADGTLYGPFTDPPAQSATVPVGAPVAGTESVTLNGPGDYFTSGSVTVSQSGFYTWVWVIDWNNQPTRTQGNMPAGYYWQDDFGRDAETSAVTIDATVTTQVDDDQVGLFQPVGDEITVLHDASTGAWFTELVAGNYEQVPVQFDGEAYWVPGDVQPALSPAPPTEAIPIGSATITVNAEGTYAGPSITSPYAGNGWIVWQWTLDNATGNFQEWSELFGEPTQMARVLAPELSTSAIAEVAFTHPATDTATLTGEPMGEDAFLSFAAYLQVDGQPTECSATTLAYDSSATPIAVRDPGDYVSPDVAFDQVGTYYWIATLTADDGTIIAQGTCGDADEITEVIPPTLASEAETGIALTDPAHDVAIVGGSSLLDPGTVTFAAYLQEDGQPDECSTATRVFDSAATPVTVGATGRYQSPAVTFDEVGTYLWIATLRSASGDVLAEGVCGDALEATEVLAMDISTVATSLVVLSTMATDTATIVGPTPSGATLEFDAYLQDPASSVPSCISANRVHDGGPVAITGAGDYESEEVAFARDGLYLWVATAFDRDGNELWRGACGEATERTLVMSRLTHNGMEIAAPIGGAIAALVIGFGAIVFVRRRREATGTA